MIDKFTLPWPPSVNGYYKPFRNRLIMSKKGRLYRGLVAIEMVDLGLYNKQIKCDVEMEVILNPPTLRKYDVDNYNKGLLDSLTHAMYWLDDVQIVKLAVTKGVKTIGGNVEITIKEYMSHD